VGIATVVVIGLIWAFLISPQMDSLKDAGAKIQAAMDKEQKMQTSVKYAKKIEADLEESNDKMTEVGNGMASGDLYSWMYNTIKEFKAGYPKIEIPQFSGVDQSDCSLIYKFPFKQVRMTVTGSGYYHDIGKFVADFENHFHQIRIQNIELSPSGGNGPERDREKLSFRMEIVALVNKSATETK
jgi:Tfp pilus assembly protein PilO